MTEPSEEQLLLGSNDSGHDSMRNCENVSSCPKLYFACLFPNIKMESTSTIVLNKSPNVWAVKKITNIFLSTSWLPRLEKVIYFLFYRECLYIYTCFPAWRTFTIVLWLIETLKQQQGIQSLSCLDSFDFTSRKTLSMIYKPFHSNVPKPSVDNQLQHIIPHSYPV